MKTSSIDSISKKIAQSWNDFTTTVSAMQVAR